MSVISAITQFWQLLAFGNQKINNSYSFWSPWAQAVENLFLIGLSEHWVNPSSVTTFLRHHFIGYILSFDLIH